MSKDKTVNISNFIGTYDNYIPEQECNKAIQFYENQVKFNNTMNRLDSEQSNVLQKQDQQYFAAPQNIDIWWDNLKPLMLNFDMAFKHYIDNTGI